MIFVKSSSDLKRMKRAGELAARILRQMGEMVRPGATTKDVNRLALRLCEEAGAKPLFLRYPGHHRNQPPFPGAICASLNSVVVHGIPDNTPLREGDILSIDFGCKLDGFCGDTAYTFPVGAIDVDAQHLLDVTRCSLFHGIQAALAGNRVGHVSHAIQTYVESRGCGAVRTMVGHGIGRSMHEDPQVPNYGGPEEGPKLRAGMTLAIEPMITRGHYDVQTLDDQWSVVTRDRSLAAHFEHVVAVGEDGPEILTFEPTLWPDFACFVRNGR
jgi:methionyl aminopeptidase